MGCLDSNPGFGFAVRCGREGGLVVGLGLWASGADGGDGDDHGAAPSLV